MPKIVFPFLLLLVYGVDVRARHDYVANKSTSRLETWEQVQSISLRKPDFDKIGNGVRGGADTKLSNFATRTASAVVALSGVFLLIKNTGKEGIIGLVLASQVGMFAEAMNVVGVTNPAKWLAFLTNALFWDAQHFFNAKTDLLNLVSFGMFTLHIGVLVLQQNRSSDFGPLLRDFCASHTASSLLLAMSSSWLGILKAYDVSWIIFPGVLVILNDTMAYISGMLLGRHALLPRISPKKTWEGFVGAAIFTVALSRPCWSLCGKGDIRQDQLFVLALYVSIVAPFGGFLASLVKRTFAAKDYGSVMPGHGGLVDRLDCQLLTAPFIYLYLQYLGGGPVSQPESFHVHTSLL